MSNGAAVTAALKAKYLNHESKLMRNYTVIEFLFRK